MNQSPPWLDDLVNATLDYTKAVGFSLLAAFLMRSVADISGADHELDYYGGVQ